VESDGIVCNSNRRVEVLLVEDSPGDVRLTREALKDAKVRINLHVARGGEEAMVCFRGLPSS
jgi:hypothetical protein